MRKRLAGILLLLVVAGIAAIFMMPSGNVHAPEIVATAPPASDGTPIGVTPHEVTLDDITEPKARTPVESADEPAPDPGGIIFKGRIVWTPPCPHEDYQSVAGKMTVAIDGCDEEGKWVADGPDGVRVSPEGKFSTQMLFSTDAEEYAEQQLLLTPGRGYELMIDVVLAGEKDRAIILVQPVINGLVVDFGDIDLRQTHFEGDNAWVITGRLLSPDGEPLGSQSQFDLNCARGLWPMPMHLETDPQGWFVLRYSQWSTNGTHDQDSVPMQAAKWWLDIGDTSYVVEEIWQFEDALLDMPRPSIDEPRRAIDFGEVRLDVSTLNVSIALSSAAKAALADKTDHCFWCSLSLSNGDADYYFTIPHDRKSRLCVMPGRYHVEALFALAAVEDDGPVIVYNDEGEFLPSMAGDWNVSRRTVDVPVMGVAALSLLVEPVREVLVHVETPSGRPKSAFVEWRCPGADSPEVAREPWEDCPLPLRVRMIPGADAELVVWVEGCDMKVVKLPAEGNELVVRLQAASPGGNVTVKFSGQEAPDFPAVTIYAAGELWGENARGEPGSGVPVSMQLAPGKWMFTASTEGVTDSDHELCTPVAVHVIAGGDHEVVLPALVWPVAKGGSLITYAGATRVEGRARGVEGTRSTRVEFDDVATAGVWDAEVLVKRDRNAEIHLPERIRVTVPGSLRADSASPLKVYAFWSGGSCECVEVGATQSLWAPPGRCTVVLSGGVNPPIRHYWDVKIAHGRVVELAAPADWGVVCITKSPSAHTDDDYRRRASSPDWRVVRLNPEAEVALLHPWPELEPLEFSLAAGDYEIRAAYGPSAKGPIPFTVIAGGRLELHLPFPASLPCNGIVLVNLPAEFFGFADATVEWAPATTGHATSGDYISYMPNCRVVDGKLRVDGLLVGEPMELSIELTCADSTKKVNWTATTAGFTLVDSKQRELSVVWTAK